MLDTQTIRAAVLDEIGNGSQRDRAAHKLAAQNLSVVKAGRYYELTLYNNSVRIYANTRYLMPHINDLLLNNDVWRLAKKRVKAHYAAGSEDN